VPKPHQLYVPLQEHYSHQKSLCAWAHHFRCRMMWPGLTLWHGQVTLINKTAHHIHLNDVLATQMFYLLPSTPAFEPISLLANPQQSYSGMLEGCEVRLSKCGGQDNTQKHVDVTCQSLPTATHVTFDLTFSCATTNATHCNYCTEQNSFVYTMWAKKNEMKWANT